MQLTYRGISYHAPDPVEVSSQGTVQGLYHGISTQITLPQVTEGLDELLGQMIYRGIQLAAH
ncbi:hypothetical protein C1752_01948 [Acaryochloris thomasi RCC1774]|uniref:DUF4278 domain-containing protein n=1 Tax=Acaryochloris thomasi RCC1774 TaxID=1764569 RepID=A0A2W1JJT3_9CYAN|nr:DUF4278 domain-containing protein [Acaryochloris thomasi]PZD73678.1 hypothetical protein C1752_01948 [Acaryochloris thomasi RCC1774]